MREEACRFLVRRVRCETLGRLDEIKTENEAKRKVQVISWQDPPTAQTKKKSNAERFPPAKAGITTVRV